ncbi:MAG: hypothetical protein ACXVHY_08415 [Methanobacterium sp.]
MSKPIVKLYYYEESGNGDVLDWVITSNLEAVSKGINFRTATLEDLEINGYLGEQFDNKVLHVDEGFFQWNHTYGDWECVNDIKDVLLDWMEHVDMENEILYEEIVGWRDWKVYSFLSKEKYWELIK